MVIKKHKSSADNCNRLSSLSLWTGAGWKSMSPIFRPIFFFGGSFLERWLWRGWRWQVPECERPQVFLWPSFPWLPGQTATLFGRRYFLLQRSAPKGTP